MTLTVIKARIERLEKRVDSMKYWLNMALPETKIKSLRRNIKFTEAEITLLKEHLNEETRNTQGEISKED